MIVPGLENQRGYWDTIGATKTSTQPIEVGWLRGLDAWFCSRVPGSGANFMIDLDDGPGGS